jgi:hypothetical protein
VSLIYEWISELFRMTNPPKKLCPIATTDAGADELPRRG